MSRRVIDPIVIAMRAFKALSPVEQEAFRMALTLLRDDSLPIVTRKRTPPKAKEEPKL